jgi:meiosis arrest female protein 1
MLLDVLLMVSRLISVFQVTVVHVSCVAKNAADDKLRQSLRRFGSAYPSPATVLLVSGDVNFAPDLSDLRHRHNLTVYLLHNPQAQKALISCAHKAFQFDKFTSSLPNCTEKVCLIIFLFVMYIYI